MLPIHIFDGSERYLLVRTGTRLGEDAERVEPARARVLLEAALRRRDPQLIRQLSVVLHLRGEDPDQVASRVLARITGTTGTMGTDGAFSGDLVLLRARQAEVVRILGDKPIELDDAPVDNEIATHWIEVELLTEDEPREPIPRARYEIELPNGQIVTGLLDDAGKVRLDGIPPGECKVSFPDYADPDPEGDVDLDDELAAAELNTCEIDSFEVECEHAGARGPALSLPLLKKHGVDQAVLEVLGAGKGEGDKIKVRNTMAGARCSAHATAGIEVARPRPAEALLFAEDFAQFEAYYGDVSLTDRLWPWDLPPTEYRVRPLTCDATARHLAVVRVYPAYEVKLGISLSLDAAERSGEKLAKTRAAGKVERRGRPAHTDWAFAIEGSVAYGSNSLTLSANLESKLRNLAAVNRWVKAAIEQFCGIFKNFFGLELELELPNLALDYTGKFVELEQSNEVGHEWSLTFAADPLFGATLSVDILDLTIRALRNVPALSVVMSFLLKARDLAKRSGNKLEFIATLSGLVGFEVSASKNGGNERAQTSAKGRGQVIVGFEATAEASVGVLWFVSFTAGASIQGATGVSVDPGILSDDEGLALTAELTLLELTFEYGAYASGKFSWETDQKTGTGKGGVGGSHTFWEEKPLMEGKKYIVRHDGAGAGQ
jgi:hypothetical protein